MPKNRLQVLYNVLEREFAGSEEVFLSAEKSRFTLRENYETILRTITEATEKLNHYPQAAVLKRIRLIETLLKDLLLRYETERRHFNALGFLIGRLRSNLATEMLEPKLYQKIRAALEQEENFARLRQKYAEAEAVVTATKAPVKQHKPARKVRLMLVAASNLHYAIPVNKIWKRTPAAGPVAEKLLKNGFRPKALPVDGRAAHDYAHAVAYSDLGDERRIVYCDTYFTPVEIPQRMLKSMVTFASNKVGDTMEHRPYLTFYGRHFFVYGARLSYTVRTGGRVRSISPER